ncbi:MAG: DUF3244 domain-containing protein [Paludibacteraceae bacterium]|nr:DUF3244 domain-containing protein [Paludibacteraceae bacterium]
MIKRFLMLIGAVICAVSALNAQTVFRPIVLHPIVHVYDPQIPGVDPTSLDDDEEAFTAMLYGSEEIVLTAETAESEVTVVVEGQNGEVYSSIEDMYAGESLEIDCSEWQSGFYTLYIYYRGETLYGVFRIR